MAAIERWPDSIGRPDGCNRGGLTLQVDHMAAIERWPDSIGQDG